MTNRPELPSAAVEAILRNDPASFIKMSFLELHPGVTLIWDPYLDLISSRLADVVSGKTRNLIITLPPRHLKSICVSVALPAYFLGHYPSREVMVVSYGQELAKKFAEDTRTLMASQTYRRLFDTRLAGSRQAVHILRTTAGGIRRATSIDGAATGVGADLLIFDDPQKPNETYSEAIRRATNQAYENTFMSRRNNPGESRTVIVMQRLHEDDFVGHVLGLGGEWEVLNLPAVAEENEAYEYETFMGRFIYGRREGGALHPGRIPLAELGLIRASIGEAAWACQYQQRPAPAGGGIVQTAWFKRYSPAERPERFDRIIQSWDTANTIAEWSNYSCGTTWGLADNRIYLLDVFRKRVQYPELKRAVIAQAKLHAPTTIAIEDRASGTQLIQELNRLGLPVEARKATSDKRMRMSNQTGQIENGFVYVPREAADAHWLPEFLHEMSVFPNGKYDDQVDSTSQALDTLGNPHMKGWAFLEIARRAKAARDLERGVGVIEERYLAPGCVEWTEQQKVLAEEKAEAAAFAAAERAAVEAAADAEAARIRALDSEIIVPAAETDLEPKPGSLEWALAHPDLGTAGAAVMGA
jgi:predicted phage terminase large subunit-like protein